MWEVSTSMIGPTRRGPFPIRGMGPRTGTILVDKCRELVSGVGDYSQGFWHIDSVSVHFRCPLTPTEIEALPEGWMACPAVDIGGREDVMTRTPPFPLSLDPIRRKL